MSARTFDQLLADAEEQLWLGFARARAKQHRGSRGASREDAVARFLTGQLPARFGVTTGEAIDAEERRTGQLDVVIYDRNITAPLLAEESGDLLPAESLLAVIEVKSTLTKAEIGKCARAAKAVARLRPYGKPFIAPRQAGSAANDGRCRCQFSVVAFSSNLGSTDWCAKEWGRIKAAVATERVSAERIDRVLVLDRGILVPPSSTARAAPGRQGDVAGVVSAHGQLLDPRGGSAPSIRPAGLRSSREKPGLGETRLMIRRQAGTDRATVS